MKKFETKQESEIKVVQDLITALDLAGAVLTFDSLHCQKSGCNRAEVSSACVAPSKLVS